MDLTEFQKNQAITVEFLKGCVELEIKFDNQIDILHAYLKVIQDCTTREEFNAYKETFQDKEIFENF